MKRKYAICGVSNRALKMFVGPMLTTYPDRTEIVALLDIDPRRFEVCKERYPGLADIPAFGPDEFDAMVERTAPDVIIATGRDDTHAGYIVKALGHDLEALTEKPMATTGADCRRIIEAERESAGRVTVAFNYRYAPVHTRIKEMVQSGMVGRVTSVDLNWYVDTYHGASYFKRWNRKRSHSGGLSIHKSSHHFDLAGWWIGQRPQEVFAYGALNYYGPEGEMNPRREDGRHCATCPVKQECRYYMRWSSRGKEVRVQDDHIGMTVQDAADGGTGARTAEPYGAYRADACIFDSDIDIEDTYSVNVKYGGGALLNYSVNFSLPYEGYRLAINGTRGRLETMEYHASGRTPFPVPVQTVDYFPLFGSKETHHVVHREGGHGGGDPVLLEELFLGPDPLGSCDRLSGSADGAYAVAVGEAVWRSIAANRPIRIDDVLEGGGGLENAGDARGARGL